jgi:hypothetical protein
MFLKLDVKLWTLIPSRLSTANSVPWVSQTPSNPTETLSQTILVRNRILCYQGNSLILFFETIRVLAKNTKRIAYEIIFLSAEIYTFRAANKALSKRCRAKKTRVYQGGVLIIEDI